jgi:hypothetical protein
LSLNFGRRDGNALEVIKKDHGVVREYPLDEGGQRIDFAIPISTKLKSIHSVAYATKPESNSSNHVRTIRKETLVALTRIHNLRMLCIIDCHVPNDGYAHLGNLKELRELALVDTGLTDADLLVLESLKNLRSLDITGNSVSDDAIARFKMRLPHCAVVCTGR